MGFLDLFKKKQSGEKLYPLGYKSGWIAIRSESADDVIKKLKLRKIKFTDWNTGLDTAADRLDVLFVSQSVNGYVIITDAAEYLIDDEDDKTIKNIAQKFDCVMGFATHRVIEAHYWSKYINGDCIRKYFYIGESGEVFSEGDISEEEKSLGLDKIYQTEEDYDNEELDFPDEDCVMQISKEWGVDPEMTGLTNVKGYIVKKGL